MFPVTAIITLLLVLVSLYHINNVVDVEIEMAATAGGKGTGAQVLT